MRNDGKGKTRHYFSPQIDGPLIPFGIEVFYASGERGKYIRADGWGGSLRRGYWSRAMGEGVHLLHGPSSCRSDAVETALQNK